MPLLKIVACEESSVGDGVQGEMKTFCQLVRSKHANDKLRYFFFKRHLFKEEM